MAISNTNKPQLPNLSVAIVNGKYSYLWPYTTKIVNGRMVRTKGKKSVGSIQGGGQTGLVIWKEEFLAQYPELKAFDVYRVELKKGDQITPGEYEFVFVDKAKNSGLNRRKDIFQAGATWVLDQLLANTPLLRALNNTFYKDQSASKIISLAYFVLLSRSLDFNNYINGVGSIRLPFPKALTERDINLFLKEISDVQIAKFFDELQYRYGERSSLNQQFYVIEHSYPNNLINNLVQGNKSLSCSNNNLHNAIKKETQQARWRTAKVQNALSTMAHSLDDRAFSLVSSSNAMPLFSGTYNSRHFSLDEILLFCQHRVLVPINKRDFNTSKDHLSQEYLEASTGGFNDIKASDTPDLMSYIGSYSDNGQIFSLSQFELDYDHQENLSSFELNPLKSSAPAGSAPAGSAPAGSAPANSTLASADPSAASTGASASTGISAGAGAGAGAGADKSLKSDDGGGKSALLASQALRSPLSKKLGGKVLTSSSSNAGNSTGFSSNLAFSAPAMSNPEPTVSTAVAKIENVDTANQAYSVTLISDSHNKLLSQLCSLCQNKQSFMLRITDNNYVINHWADHFIELLITNANYSEANQEFSLSTDLTLSVTDPSLTQVIKGKSGKLVSINKKVRQNLALNIKLDLGSLFNQLQEQENSLLNLEEGYGDTLGFWDINRCLKLTTLNKQKLIDDKLEQMLSEIKDESSHDNNLSKATLLKLKCLCKYLLKLNHQALPIVLSNNKVSMDQACYAHQLLSAKEQFYDFMSWDIFKVERLMFDPFTYLMRPEISQLLRAKLFILFISSSLYSMIQCATFNKDQSYGTNEVRKSLGFDNPDQYLKLVNSISAERKSEGLIYCDLNMEQQSLLEYLDINAPAKESFDNVNSDSQVAMRNYETHNDWFS